MPKLAGAGAGSTGIANSGLAVHELEDPPAGGDRGRQLTRCGRQRLNGLEGREGEERESRNQSAIEGARRVGGHRRGQDTGHSQPHHDEAEPLAEASGKGIPSTDTRELDVRLRDLRRAARPPGRRPRSLVPRAGCPSSSADSRPARAAWRAPVRRARTPEPRARRSRRRASPTASTIADRREARLAVTAHRRPLRPRLQRAEARRRAGGGSGARRRRRPCARGDLRDGSPRAGLARAARCARTRARGSGRGLRKARSCEASLSKYRDVGRARAKKRTATIDDCSDRSPAARQPWR